MKKRLPISESLHTLFCAAMVGATVIGFASVASARQFGNLNAGGAQDPTQETGQPPILDDLINPNQDENQDSGISGLLPSAQTDMNLMPSLDRGPAQAVAVRTKYSGWEEADWLDRDAAIHDRLRGHWVMISNAGRLTGRVIGDASVDISNLSIYLLRHGVVTNFSRTDLGGNFEFENLEPGTYSMIGFGPNAFFAFAFNGIDYHASTANQMPNTIEVAAVPNQTTINLDWIRHFSPAVQFRVLGRFDFKEGSEDPPKYYGVDGLGVFGPLADPSSSIRFRPARLTPDGSLVGRLHQINERNGRPVDVRNMRVMLLKDDDVANAVSADNFGVFRFDSVEPGKYALVAAGADGMACIGIQVVESMLNKDEEAAEESSEEQDAAEVAQDAAGDWSEQKSFDVLDVAIVSPDTVGWLNHEASELAYFRGLSRPNPNANCCPQSQCPFDPSQLVQRRNRGLRHLVDVMSGAADILFYGETQRFDNTDKLGHQYGCGTTPMKPENGGCGTGTCGDANCPSCNPGMMMPNGVAPPATGISPSPATNPTLPPAPGPMSIEPTETTPPTEATESVPTSQNTLRQSTQR